MKTLLFTILLASCLSGCFLSGCRSKSSFVAVAERSLDSLASLRSMSAKALERVEVWETVTMRPDSSGALVVVARDIVRHETRQTETESKADTAVSSVSEQRLESETEETAAGTAAAERRGTGRVAFMWGLWASLAVLLAVYMSKKWKHLKEFAR